MVRVLDFDLSLLVSSCANSHELLQPASTRDKSKRLILISRFSPLHRELLDLATKTTPARWLAEPNLAGWYPASVV